MRPDRWWDVLRMRLQSLVRRDTVEQRLDQELRYHLDRQIEENLAAGMTPADARSAALRMIGGYSQVQEECRDMRRTEYIENLRQDLHYAWRTLARTPAFAIVIVLTLGLSIGANTAIFSVIDGVLLKPLPYPHAERLTRVFYRSQSFKKFPMNPWDFLDFRAANRSFESFAMYTRADLQLSGTGDPVKLSVFAISSGYFRVLGVAPAKGREFEFSEERPGNHHVAILSDGLWRRQFGAAPDILGRTIMLDSEQYTIVGVMPPGLDHPGNSYNSVAYGDTVDAWIVFPFRGNPGQRGSHFVEGIGRLKPGVTAAQAAADFNSIMTGLAAKYQGDRGWTIFMSPLYDEIVGPVQRMLLVLLGAVGLVLLIACVNAANLLLARATSRKREISVRAAMGASRARLVRQMLTESLLISLLGGLLGAAVAIVGLRVLIAMLPPGFPRVQTIHVNAWVFAFTAVVSIATGVLFGLAPALQAARADLQEGLREGGRGATGGGRQARLRGALVVAEVSLACLLLIGAGVMLRSFANLMHSSFGFHPQQVLTASISLPRATYKNADDIAAFFKKLLPAVNSLTAVRAAGVGTDLPWTGYDENYGGWEIEGKTLPKGQETHARYHVASTDYFRALGVPLANGRFFDDRDAKGAKQVLVINQAMARLYWPNENPVGSRLNFGDSQHPDLWTITGVVGDVKDHPESPSAEPAFWWSLYQQPFGFANMSLVVRSSADPALLAGELRRAVQRLDPSLALADMRLLDRVADENFSAPRFALLLVGMFAALALILAAIGIYGVISYSVSRRMREFGMRVALGARGADLLRLVMGEGVVLTVVGVAIGIACALGFGRILDVLLYGVTVRDPLTLATVAIVAISTAALASYPSARRAITADPIETLRAE